MTPPKRPRGRPKGTIKPPEERSNRTKIHPFRVTPEEKQWLLSGGSAVISQIISQKTKGELCR